MSETKFTPGPWTVPHFALSDEHWRKFNESMPGDMKTGLKHKGRCDCQYVLCDSYMGAICTVHVSDGKPIDEGGGDDPPKEEAAANGCLIASAPLLYKTRKGSKIMITTNKELANGDGLEKKARALLDAAYEYWKEYQKTLGSSAVVWLDDTDGKMVIFTRSEYREQLMQNIHQLNRDIHSF